VLLGHKLLVTRYFTKMNTMSSFEQEWVSPILEVYKKRKLVDRFNVLLGLNPLGQILCRELYEEQDFETVLVINSPNFSSWNRYPANTKPPVVPVHGMINDELMIIFGDVFIREFEWLPDLLFYLRGNVSSKFVVAIMTHDGPTCGQVISNRGERLLKRMGVPLGRADFYDGLTAPLISLGSAAGLDSILIFLEKSLSNEIIFQVDEISVSVEDVQAARIVLEKGLRLKNQF
jgi:hypothetical protein